MIAQLLIASRSPTICDKDWSMLLDVIAKSGVANHLSGNVEVVDQTNCPRGDMRDIMTKLVAEYSHQV
jgi:hypothetical protein